MVRHLEYDIVEMRPEAAAPFLKQAALAGWMSMPSSNHAVAALSGGRVLGGASVHRYWLHPQRWRIEVYVDPDSRRHGIGSALVGALAAKLPARDRAMQAAVYAGETAAINFLRHLGFALMMTTRMGKLDPRRVLSGWRDAAGNDRGRVDSTGYRLESLASSPAARGEVAAFHGLIYAAQHAWDPPVALSREQCASLFLDEGELDPEMQYMVLCDTTVCAVASLRTTDDPAELELCGVGVDVGNDAIRMVRALLGTCVERAWERGATVSVEVDRVDRDVNAVVDELPMEWTDTWLTFSRDFPPCDSQHALAR